MRKVSEKLCCTFVATEKKLILSLAATEPEMKDCVTLKVFLCVVCTSYYVCCWGFSCLVQIQWV